MLTLGLQIAAAVLSALFGTAALIAYHHHPESREHRRHAWLLTGLAFFIGGLLGSIQITWASIAYFAGPESDIWATYLRWAPAGNNSRAALKIVFALILATLPFARPPLSRRSLIVTSGVLAASIVVGALVGWIEGPFVGVGHFLTIATTSAALVVVLAVALLVQVQRDTMDQLLWFCLCIYGLRISLGALWASARSWIGISGALPPSPWFTGIVGVIAYSAMIALALRFASLQKRGVAVPGLLEHLRPARTFR